MKLILGSDLSFLLKYGYDLTGISKDKMKIGRVIDASKGEGEQTQLFMEKVKKTIQENGYFIEDIEIRGKTEDEIKDFFKDKNVIHVEGGNTFYLLKTIRETNFAGILKDLLEAGKVYIGTSAGSYVMCPTIEVSSWGPNRDKNCGLSDFTALNYVPFVLNVHYKDEKAERVKEGIKTLKYPIHILRDGQGMFCENGNCKFVGDGEEVKLD
jgi:dipeptidase E